MQRALLIIGLLAVLTVASAVRASDLTAQELKDGRKLYTAKCARCHKFYDPARYSEPEWNKWMEKMSKKAKLKPDQKELLSRYLDTFRTSTTNAPGK
jgi:cytochrome c553